MGQKPAFHLSEIHKRRGQVELVLRGFVRSRSQGINKGLGKPKRMFTSGSFQLICPSNRHWWFGGSNFARFFSETTWVLRIWTPPFHNSFCWFPSTPQEHPSPQKQGTIQHLKRAPSTIPICTIHHPNRVLFIDNPAFPSVSRQAMKPHPSSPIRSGRK